MVEQRDYFAVFQADHFMRSNIVVATTHRELIGLLALADELVRCDQLVLAFDPHPLRLNSRAVCRVDCTGGSRQQKSNKEERAG